MKWYKEKHLLSKQTKKKKKKDGIKLRRGENKIVKELVEVEYISLHGYIRNTPSDTEVHAERQLREDRRTWPAEKNIETHTKHGRTEELGGKTGVSVGLDLSSVGRGTEAGVWSPQRSNCLSQRRNI